MSEKLASLSEWFSERPKWLQVAASKLVEDKNFAANNIDELVSFCQKEAEGALIGSGVSFPVSAFSKAAVEPLRLSSISGVVGVNALAPRKPLEFGKNNLTVVYGLNGSGKSGYVRLLKHVCGARNLGVLHRNVYKPDSTEQAARITFEQDGTEKSHVWSGQGICKELNSVDIFDTSFGRIFVSSEDEVRYEPPVLSFFSALIEVCEKVAGRLDAEVNRRQSKKPNMPADKKLTAEGVWYSSISAKTKLQDIEQHCTFESKDEAEMHTLQQRLAEQAPAEKAKQLQRQKQRVDALVLDARKYLEQLSDENCKRIIAAKKESTLKKLAADTAAEKVFSDSPLEGVGSEIWRELWDAARSYSVSLAYEELEYPNVSDSSRCVLCHQSLSKEAKDRLVSFESFVKGEMQKAASDATKEYEAAAQTVGILPTLESLETRIDATGIQKENDGIVCQVTEFFAQLQTRKDQLLEADPEETVPASLPSLGWIEDASAHSKRLGEAAAKYEEDAKSDNRDKIKKKLNSLKAKVWLSEHRAAIDEEVNRLKLVSHIQKAKKATNTKALSEKKGELAEALITDAFVWRFNAELKNLGASQVKVELVKSRVTKGRVLHKFKLKGAAQGTIADILSEGENRIVSIAAFLADVTGRSYPAPFVFDDPISSLDQDYEEAVVQRLCSLSSDRQVIIFTHRLPLLGLVQDYAKKLNIDHDIICIREESWGTGEPGDTPLFAKKPVKALNSLINDRLPKAKKLHAEHGKEFYEPYAKFLCSEFRMLLERMIESELIADVVQRYRRAINTMGKIGNLAKISEEDCTYFDELMTKYSKYEHSQPLEAPVPLPEPDELESDFNGLKQWQSEFKNRPLAAAIQGTQ